MILEAYISAQKRKGGIWELLGVILQITLQFVNDNLFSKDKIFVPKLYNPIIIYWIGVYIVKIVKAISMFKHDYNKFHDVYMNPVDYNLNNLNNFLK